MTLACGGLHVPRHDWCQGFGFQLVPGQVEYAVEDCKCACHRRMP